MEGAIPRLLGGYVPALGAVLFPLRVGDILAQLWTQKVRSRYAVMREVRGMIGLLILLVVVGVVLAIIPMEAGIKRIIVAVIALLVVLVLLGWLGYPPAHAWRWR